MTFLVTLIALLIERFFDWSHLRKWNWYNAYQRACINRFPKLSPYLVLLGSIVVILIVAMIIDWILRGWIFGLLFFIFNLVVLLYCLGPKNLWLETFASSPSIAEEGPLSTAPVKKAPQTIPASPDGNEIVNEQFLDHFFIAANRRIFAVIFWFIILGPLGALLYRMVAISASSEVEGTAIKANATYMQSLLDWLPIRVFTLIFALSGNFSKVFNCWRKNLLLGVNSNEKMLIECGKAAISSEEKSENNVTKKSLINLIDRTLIIILVIIAVEVLIV